VLGHEIGHVTARHSVRQASAAQAANIGTTLGAIFFPVLRTQAAGGLVNAFGTALLRGYGRDQELEADRLGATYLVNVGLPPQAMLDVLGVLKGQEQVELALAKQEGREPHTYHGVFSSHPDNDTRLQEAVLVTRTLPASPAESAAARSQFVAKLEGLTFGESTDEGVVRNGGFYHSALGFAFDLPPGWTVTNQPDSVIVTAPNGEAAMQLTTADLSKRVPPRVFMTEQLGLGNLKAEGDITHGDIPGHSAVASVSGSEMRVNVLYLDTRAYVFLGAVRDRNRIGEFDQQFLQTARSFRRLAPGDVERARALRIVVRTAEPGMSFASLAAKSPLGASAEAQLRLLNGAYPAGEPVVGQPVKLVE
jgi:predicted Zn-dependent protease